MKAYLAVTALSACSSRWPISRTITEWSRIHTERGFWVKAPDWELLRQRLACGPAGCFTA